MARKRKQGFLPTMEPPSIPAIEEAAEEYVAYRDTRMAALKSETEAHDALLEAMRAAGQDSYEFDGQIVALVSKTKVSVRRKKEENRNGEE